jgi:pilus assembly protein Flp/PilA
MRMRAFLVKEEGASAVEYAVLAALIIAVAVVIIAVLGHQVENAFHTFVDIFSGTGN